MAAKMQFFDGLALRAVVEELNSLGECRIDKVGQFSAQGLYLNLRAGGRNLRLLICVQDQWARLHLTRRTLANVPSPSSFVMQLRKHLEGSRLLRIEQPGLERLVRLVVAGRDELGDPYERVLVVELIGRFANLFLVDARDGSVLGCLRSITDAMCQARQVGPGLPYDPPPQTKVDFLDAEDDDFLAAMRGGGKLSDCISRAVSGLSRVAAAQLVVAMGLNPGVGVDDLDGLRPLLDLLLRARQLIVAGRFYARLEAQNGWDYSVWWLSEGEPPPHSPSEFFDQYYGAREDRHLLEMQRQKLFAETQERISRQRSRLKGWEETLALSEGADRQREMGDILTAHMWQLKPGMTAIEVTDFYDPEQTTVRIPLDEALSPSENVQRYYKRYQKARNSRAVVSHLIAQGRDELAYLEQVDTAVALAPTVDDLKEIDEELHALRADHARTKDPKKRTRTGAVASIAPSPLRFISTDGLVIWVGKNNRQNEQVTFKMARGYDMWLHAQNIPGSHVVIQSEGEIPIGTLQEAALLAAWYSQARESSRVPVVYTRRKHVRKPRGGRPGMVIYDNEKTLFVTPDVTEVSQIKPI